MKKARQSNIELLRIVAMIMIVTAHNLVISNYPHTSVERKVNLGVLTDFGQFIFDTLTMTGQIGNACFFLIAGYFAAKNGIKLRHCLKIIKVVLFWTVFSFVLGQVFSAFGVHLWDNVFVVGGGALGLFSTIEFFFTGGLWFVGSYIAIQFVGKFLLKPFLNLKLAMQIAILGILFVAGYLLLRPLALVPILPNIISISTVQFFWVFALGALLYQCRDKPIITTIKTPVVIAIFALLLNVTTYTIMSSDYFSLQIIIGNIAGVALFMCFNNMKPFFNKSINTIAKSTFGIYILHVAPYSFSVFLGFGLRWIGSDPSHYILDLLWIPFVFIICATLESLRIQGAKLIGIYWKKFIRSKPEKIRS